MREIVIVGLSILMMLACGEEPDCELSLPKNSVTVNFFDSEDSTELEIRFVAVTERMSDYVFYDSDTVRSSFELNLNPEEDHVTYVFLSSTSVDTLTLGYSSQLEWLSDECGPSFSYDQLEVVGSSFTYDFVSDIIDVAIDENIKIYY